MNDDRTKKLIELVRAWQKACFAHHAIFNANQMHWSGPHTRMDRLERLSEEAALFSKTAAIEAELQAFDTGDE